MWIVCCQSSVASLASSIFFFWQDCFFVFHPVPSLSLTRLTNSGSSSTNHLCGHPFHNINILQHFARFWQHRNCRKTKRTSENNTKSSTSNDKISSKEKMLESNVLVKRIGSITHLMSSFKMPFSACNTSVPSSGSSVSKMSRFFFL